MSGNTVLDLVNAGVCRIVMPKTMPRDACPADMTTPDANSIPGEAESFPLPSSVEDDGKGKETAADAGTPMPQVQSPEQTGIALIAAERARQVGEEGWTPEHDDSHKWGEMRLAAVAYAYQINSHYSDGYTLKKPPEMWPWTREWFKPSTDPVRQLTKAGALIAAEIDRLLRARGAQGSEVLVPQGPAGNGPNEKIGKEVADFARNHSGNWNLLASFTTALFSRHSASLLRDNQEPREKNERLTAEALRARGPQYEETGVFLLEDVKDRKAIWAALIGSRVLIWQGDHGGAWWRHRGKGYTIDRREAGVFDFLDAWGHTNHCGPEKQIQFERLAVPVSSDDTSNVGSVVGEAEVPPLSATDELREKANESASAATLTPESGNTRGD